MKTDPSILIDQYLSEIKGFPLSQAQELNTQVKQMAAEAGLTYKFDRAVVPNSFTAHRLSHLAKQHDLGVEAEEGLFKAYFTDGKNIDDLSNLISLGTRIGIDEQEIKSNLEGKAFAAAVKQHVAEAQQLGIRSVPFLF